MPEFRFTTDNAAMIAVAGYYHYLHGDFSSLDVSPVARIGKQTSSDDENEESPALQQRKRTFFRKFHLTFYYLCRK